MKFGNLLKKELRELITFQALMGMVFTMVLLIVMGIALQALSHTLGGSNVKDFFAGLLLGMSIVEMLAGVYVIAKEYHHR